MYYLNFQNIVFCSRNLATHYTFAHTNGMRYQRLQKSCFNRIHFLTDKLRTRFIKINKIFKGPFMPLYYQPVCRIPVFIIY